MEFLGVGPLELFFILIIALIFLGPRDMVKAGRTLGKFMRKIVMSPTWRMVQQTSRELRTLPNRMIREAGMEEDIKDLNQIRKDMENQIGTIRKPFSAAASEADETLQAAQSGLPAQSDLGLQAGETKNGGTTTPAHAAGQANLSAWITAPPSAEPEVNLGGIQASNPAGASDQAAPASTETQNPNAA
jgi:Sec-independent protein translocase protein TatA